MDFAKDLDVDVAEPAIAKRADLQLRQESRAAIAFGECRPVAASAMTCRGRSGDFDGSLGSTHAQPNENTRSNQPLGNAGIDHRQIGKTKTIASDHSTRCCPRMTLEGISPPKDWAKSASAIAG